MKWLVRRLPAAREAILEVSVEISEGVVDLDGESVDAALRFGVGPYPGLHARRLLRCSLQLVVVPSLLAATPAPSDPLEPHGTLLLGDTGSGRWSGLVAWERYAEGRGMEPHPMIVHQNFDRPMSGSRRPSAGSVSPWDDRCSSRTTSGTASSCPSDRACGSSPAIGW